jgi:transposase
MAGMVLVLSTASRLMGDANAIHASAPREQRRDKRDARQILQLLIENRFPAIWQPSVANQEQRQLLLHRCRLVRMRTRIKNQLDSIAKNEGLTGSRSWSAKRRQQIEDLPLTSWYAQRRADLLGEQHLRKHANRPVCMLLG